MENRQLSRTVVQGEVEVSSNPNMTLTTILGSCISVCMWDELNQVGGMNHFLLAESNEINTIKYGAYSMEVLINMLIKENAQRNHLKAKIFGGASVSKFSNKIGEHNSNFAINFLEREGIQCLGSSIGGTMARRLKFTPTNGQVKMMFVQPTEVSEKPKLQKVAINDVTLFL